MNYKEKVIEPLKENMTEKLQTGRPFLSLFAFYQRCVMIKSFIGIKLVISRALEAQENGQNSQKLQKMEAEP